MKKTAIMVFCTIIFWGNKIAHAQKACEIYSVIVDSIYKKNAYPKVATNISYPIDPINPKIDTPITYDQVFIDYLVKVSGNIKFNEYELKDWFFNLINYPPLKSKKFHSEGPFELDSTIQKCWIQKDLSYSMFFCNSNDGQLNSDKLIGDNKNQEKNVLRITLSSILYSNDEKTALVYLMCGFGNMLSHEFKWAYLLEKKKKGWSIIKVVGDAN